VGSEPNAIMNVTDACAANQPQLNFDSSGIGLQYKWLLDGTLLPGMQSPQLNGISTGPHQLQLVVSSPFGCGPDDTASANFIILAEPVIDFDRIQSCTTIQFHATQIDNATSISEWSWDFGDGQVSGTQDPLHLYPATGDFHVILKARADNGCYSDTASMIIHTVPAYAFAGNDTVVVKDLPFQLHASGNGTFQWWPGTGLSDISTAQPSGQLSSNQQYELTVTTAEGCRAKDSIQVKVFTGPAVYVPTAFTPNGDGLNDVLQPIYVGISRLDRFVIYNRWGQPVFSTSSMNASWDGQIGQKLQGAGSFVWMAKGENMLHQNFIAKGTITIIR
jgi:gliding motility-associated-like protein